MGYSDKDIIIISVCLFTLTVAIVMYFALCVSHVYRRRCKLRGVRRQDLPKDAKTSISRKGMSYVCSASSRTLKTISQQPSGGQTFGIANEDDRIGGSMCYSGRESEHQIKPANKREEDEWIGGSMCYSGRESEHQIKLTNKRGFDRRYGFEDSIPYLENLAETWTGTLSRERRSWFRLLSKDEHQMSVNLSELHQVQPSLWVPPPPPDPPNPN